MAKRRKTQNNGGKTSNPPTQREIGGRETSNPSPPREETGGRETVTIDTDLLDCSICTNPLCPPLYQCMNGHMACYSCWSKVQYKCPSCDNSIGARIIPLEKILESIHLPCPNASLGCCKSVSYSQMQVHTDTCELGSFLCPIPECAHKASSGEWREHFRKDHRQLDCDFFYGHFFSIIFAEEDFYCSFFGPGNDLFLLVKEPIPTVGNVITLFYIDLPDLGQNNYSFELEVADRPNMTNSVHLKSQVDSIKE